MHAHDRLYLLVREEVAEIVNALIDRWRTGPIAQPQDQPRRLIRAHRAVLSVRPASEDDGDASRPDEVDGIDVVRQLRTRRDVPGALVLLADGRYAICGPIVAVGPPGLLQRHIRRSLHQASSDEERAWWQEVSGAITSASL